MFFSNLSGIQLCTVPMDISVWHCLVIMSISCHSGSEKTLLLTPPLPSRSHHQLIPWQKLSNIQYTGASRRDLITFSSLQGHWQRVIVVGTILVFTRVNLIRGEFPRWCRSRRCTLQAGGWASPSYKSCWESRQHAFTAGIKQREGLGDIVLHIKWNLER